MFIKKIKSLIQNKKENNEEIEILDLNEPVKYEKKKTINKLINNKYALVSGFLIIVFIILISAKNGTNVIAMSTKKLLSGVGIYTEEIKNVEIKSTDYNSPGSWHIDKSAKWTSTNTAQVTFDVNSIMKNDNRYKDVILVLDRSGSMDGDKINRVKNDSKELINAALSNNQNRVALITFESSSTIVSTFSNNKEELLEKVDAITTTGNTNYNAGLKNVDIVMNNYIKKANRDVVTLFLTDGYPNEDTPNQISTYELLKDKYPYMAINGVQYEMGKDIIYEIKQISDNQWIADQSTLNNVLFEASIAPVKYEDFIVTDYIHDDYFKINSVNDIKVSMGTVKLEEESGLQKITWNLGKNAYMTGGNAKMYIDLTLKEQYVGSEGFYPTNKKENITYKLPEGAEKTVNSTSTPVLKNNYDVIYDANTPSGCTLPSIPKEKHFIYQNVTKRADELSCNGYLFKGWEIDEEDEKDITKVNDDVFVMPEHDVTIKGTWTRHLITKSMDGKVNKKTNLYRILQNEASKGTYAKEYTGTHQDSMDISKSTEKIYHYYGSNDENGEAILDKNNVIFAGQCWQMIRTTDTGGVKMIYNGEAVDNKCLSTRDNHVGYESVSGGISSSNIWYGTDYTYDSSTKTFKIAGLKEKIAENPINNPNTNGKYTCRSSEEDATCSTLYLIEPGSVLIIKPNAQYSQIGTIDFNRLNNLSLSSLGYMYNKSYNNKNKSIGHSEGVLSLIPVKSMAGYWYADSIEWVGQSINQYSLVNPLQANEATNPADLIGKYTLLRKDKSSTSYTAYYISSMDNSIYYGFTLYYGATLDSKNNKYTFGDSYIDNGDGTFTIENPTTIDSLDWPKKFENMKNKYVCKNASNNTCSDIWYTRSTYFNSFGYMELSEAYKYAKGFSYDGTKYILNDGAKNLFDLNNETLSNSHYTCWNTSGECTTLSYVYYIDKNNIYYIDLTEGKSIENTVDEMLYNDDVNLYDSTIKLGIEAWYKKYLTPYDDYIEDTIYCNDRSQINKQENGWNPNGGDVYTQIHFYGSNDLNCPNENDKFSTENEKAKLNYKVGLITYQETNLLNNSNVVKTGHDYWTATPNYFFDKLAMVSQARGWYIDSSGKLYGSDISYPRGVRPAISLRPGIEYTDGDGSMANPYIIDLSE